MNETTLKILKVEQAKLEREIVAIEGHITHDETKLKNDKAILADIKRRHADITEELNRG